MVPYYGQQGGPPIAIIRQIRTAPCLTFDVATSGPADAPLVLLLHGFGVSRQLWGGQLAAVGVAGFLAWAPNQRGYSPCARPDPVDLDEYRIDRLIDDVLDLAALAGYAGWRFHLVGHDWGGILAWKIADRVPHCLASLSVLSRPHPLAFARALRDDPEQAGRSRHHAAFREPGAAARLLADDAAWLRTRLAANGVPQAAVEAHLSVLGTLPAMEAALAWYRANDVRRAVGPTRVPTLFVWGDADDTVGRMAAEATAEFIEAHCTFKILPGVGHYAADQQPERVTELLERNFVLSSE